jgi:hypothetical protein
MVESFRDEDELREKKPPPVLPAGAGLRSILARQQDRFVGEVEFDFLK